MKYDPTSRLPEECAACQRQLSELADSGAPLSGELPAHVAACDECARFARQWLQGPPAALARPTPTPPDPRLRERILDAANPPANVVPFPGATALRPPWTTWLGRIAATVALGGFAYWLLNPVATPLKDKARVAGAPTLSQGLAQMEDRTKHEQQVIQTALVDGGREVDGSVAWSVSALEL